MARKIYRATLGLKSSDDGKFLARFASIGPPPDAQMDITEPGAFTEGQEVPVGSFNHEGGLPVGKGRIHADDREALIEGAFFLNTEGGRETYETLKAMGNVEWSYVFDVLDSGPGEWQGQTIRRLRRLDVWSVDPVLRGAGRNTALLEIKGRGRYLARLDPEHAMRDIRWLEAWLRTRPKTGAPMRPAEARIELDALTIDNEISDIEARVEAAGPGNHPTNREQVRARLAEAWPGTSAAWLAVMVEAELQNIARRIQEGDVRITNAVDAARLVDVWARTPARAA